jgi:hypothetical protein
MAGLSMSEGGIISHTENMPEPAEGWQHVDARVRDHAYEMLECEWAVSPSMVATSEALHRTKPGKPDIGTDHT